MNTERAKELVELLSEECGNMGDVQAMLKNLFAGTISSMLEAEMDEHLGYDKGCGKKELHWNKKYGIIESKNGRTRKW